MLQFFGCLAGPLGYILNFIYNIVQNYGVAIIIFTILLKLVMIPISIKQQKSLKASKKIQEEMNELKEKYSNDPERLNQETIELYKRENMNPFGGCLTSIVQLVILMSIFLLVGSPLTYMKKVDSNVINEYVEEIKQNNSNVRYQEIAVVNAKGNEDDRVKINMIFLGLDLSMVPTQDMKNPTVFIIPALYVISTIVSMKLTNSMTGSNKKKDVSEPNNDEKSLVKKDEDDFNAMEEASKNMMLLMPVMSVSIALIAPLGLALYWFVNNILMIIERLVLNKCFKEE